MTIGLLGKKLGMTRIYDDSGSVIPVTVIEAGPCRIVQVKNKEKDGYSAIQLGFDPVSEKSLNKPALGHLRRAGVDPVRVLREFRADDLEGYETGQQLDLSLFEEGEKVDVTGISKGRGFAGVQKRHGASRGGQTHGSRYHRKPGSMGASADPARVFKQKKLPGQMGAERVTTQNLKVVKLDKGRNLLLIRGSVPGGNNGYLMIRKSVKDARKRAAPKA